MFKNLFDILVLLVMRPRVAWHKINKAAISEADLRRDYLFPIWGLISLASLLGAFSHGDLQYAIKLSAISFVSCFLSYLLASFALNEVVGYFDLVKDKDRTRIFVGYASCIVYLLHFINELQIFSQFFFLGIFQLYTAYVVWDAVGNYYKVNENKRLWFVGVFTIVLLCAPMAVRWLLGLLMPGIS